MVLPYARAWAVLEVVVGHPLWHARCMMPPLISEQASCARLGEIKTSNCRIPDPKRSWKILNNRELQHSRRQVRQVVSSLRCCFTMESVSIWPLDELWILTQLSKSYIAFSAESKLLITFVEPALQHSACIIYIYVTIYCVKLQRSPVKLLMVQKSG